MQEEKLFKIGEISKRFHVSEQALRLYDKMSLFVPDVVDKSTGYRYYSYTQFEQLRIILFLKDIGLPLNTIQQLVVAPQEEEYIQILTDLKDKLTHRIHLDIAKKKYLEEKIENLSVVSKLKQNQVLLLDFPDQQIVRYDKIVKERVAHEEALAEFIEYCQMYPGLGRVGQLFDPNQMLENNVIAAKSLFVRKEICNCIPEDKKDIIYSDYFPAGKYATMYYQKRTEDSLPYIRTLLNEVKKKSLTPLGDIIRTITFEVGESNYPGSGYLACIRVLVQQS